MHIYYCQSLMFLTASFRRPRGPETCCFALVAVAVAAVAIAVAAPVPRPAAEDLLLQGTTLRPPPRRKDVRSPSGEEEEPPPAAAARRRPTWRRTCCRRAPPAPPPACPPPSSGGQHPTSAARCALTGTRAPGGSKGGQTIKKSQRTRARTHLGQHLSSHLLLLPALCGRDLVPRPPPQPPLIRVMQLRRRRPRLPLLLRRRFPRHLFLDLHQRPPQSLDIDGRPQVLPDLHPQSLLDELGGDEVASAATGATTLVLLLR